MTTPPRAGAISVLLAMLALLLPAGVLTAVVIVDDPGATEDAADEMPDAAALSRSPHLDGRSAARSAQPTAAPPDSVSTTSSPPPVSDAARSVSTPVITSEPGPTGATLPPGVPSPSGPPPTGIPDVPPGSAWSGERDGVSARMRIDPPAPVAGQMVRFFLDVSSAEPCCTVLLDFGDGSDGFSVNNGRSCEGPSPLTPGAHSAVATHTYAPGAFTATLTVFAGDSCSQPPTAPGSPPLPPVIRSVSVTGCIGVGPGTAGCSPFPKFGPDSIVSPVLDPLCQVRSDCTKASPPR